MYSPWSEQEQRLSDTLNIYIYCYMYAVWVGTPHSPASTLMIYDYNVSLVDRLSACDTVLVQLFYSLTCDLHCAQMSVYFL